MSFYHQVSDMVEADWGFVQGQAVLLRQRVDHHGRRNRLDDLAAQPLTLDQVTQRQRKDGMRVDETAVRVNRADAVGIAVGRQAEHPTASAELPRPVIQVAHDRFGIIPPKPGLSAAANSVTCVRVRERMLANAPRPAPHMAS